MSRLSLLSQPHFPFLSCFQHVRNFVAGMGPEVLAGQLFQEFARRRPEFPRQLQEHIHNLANRRGILEARERVAICESDTGLPTEQAEPLAEENLQILLDEDTSNA